MVRGGLTGKGQEPQTVVTLWMRMQIWIDPHLGIARLKHTVPGPRQWLRRPIIHRDQLLESRGKETEIHFVRGHMRVEGNERVIEAVKVAAETSGARRCIERFESLVHINRTITERK